MENQRMVGTPEAVVGGKCPFGNDCRRGPQRGDFRHTGDFAAASDPTA